MILWKAVWYLLFFPEEFEVFSSPCICKIEEGMGCQSDISGEQQFQKCLAARFHLHIFLLPSYHIQKCYPKHNCACWPWHWNKLKLCFIISAQHEWFDFFLQNVLSKLFSAGQNTISSFNVPQFAVGEPQGQVGGCTVTSSEKFWWNALSCNECHDLNRKLQLI